MQSEAVSAQPAAACRLLLLLPACLPATDCGGERELCATEMAEGELDVDSLISRLLEGEFAIARRLISSSPVAR